MDELYNNIILMISNMGIIGIFISSLLIVVESILPILPLFVFITINCLVFGMIFGFIISWFFTVIGCMLSYHLTKKYLKNYCERKFKNNSIYNSLIKFIKKSSFSKLTVLIAIPFTPAFLVNIVAGIANIDFKKYFLSIIIGKIFLVVFWGTIGTGLIESIKNPIILTKIGIMLLGAYIVSIVIKKLFKIS